MKIFLLFALLFSKLALSQGFAPSTAIAVKIEKDVLHPSRIQKLEYRELRDIKIGDEVVACAPKTNVCQLRQVTGVTKIKPDWVPLPLCVPMREGNEKKYLMHWHMVDKNHEILKTFKYYDKPGWGMPSHRLDQIVPVPVKNLREGDILYSANPDFS